MSGFAEYDQYDGLGLAQMIRNGEVTAEEVCNAAIRRIEALNPSLNAVITPMFGEGRRVVQAGPEGPFAGVPFLLKDLLHAYAGVRMTYGSAAMRDFVPDHDSTVVKRFKRAGLVALGKTNVPEFGLMGVTEPEAFGPTRNPWDLQHTPGGSSGGSAAAVAARMVPLASANDGGGSIRIPAACCGLFGLKPSRGRVPMGPDYGEAWDGAVCDHVLTRTVRDSAAMLDVLHGPAPGDPYHIAPPDGPFRDAIQQAPESLRVGFSTRHPVGGAMHPECVQAVEDAAALLDDLGHHVEPAEPDVDGLAVTRAYITLYFGQIAADLDWITDYLGAKAAQRMEAGTRALALIGKSLSAGDYVASRRSWNTFARAMGAFHQRYDLYLTSTLAAPPARIGELMPGAVENVGMTLINTLNVSKLMVASGIVDRLATDNFARLPFTQLANLTGQPAMSVPLHWTDEGLPCGVQFIAPFGQEARLLRLAAQLEAAQPWAHRRPPLVASMAS
jgi:amidase